MQKIWPHIHQQKQRLTHIASKTTLTANATNIMNPSNETLIINALSVENQIGGASIDANGSFANCRNIKLFLRLNIRYFYDVNCELIKA